jgi:D-tyrosyl-tRNA(Tyr) deacylase
MKALLQRVGRATVTVDGVTVSAIHAGLVVFVGVTHTDTPQTAITLAKKVAHCRLFDDANGVMNESLQDQGLSVLSISQFTLYAATQKGHRPSYLDAANGEVAQPLYEAFNQALRTYCPVATGVFGADMTIDMQHQGPVTLLLEVD